MPTSPVKASQKSEAVINVTLAAVNVTPEIWHKPNFRKDNISWNFYYYGNKSNHNVLLWFIQLSQFIQSAEYQVEIRL